MVRRFCEIPNEELKNGIELCFKNASSLIEDAKILVEHGSYGHARFLSLSAIEETYKAFTYALKRIDVKKDGELACDIYDHKSKFSMFIASLLGDALGKVIEKGREEINKPLDIADFDKMGKDLDSAITDLKVGREESLYVDYQQGKWMSPSDISREESESWLKIAEQKKAEFEPLCKSLTTVTPELARAFNEFFENQLIPSVRDQFYKNADELYKNKKITKELYERILDSKKAISLKPA